MKAKLRAGEVYERLRSTVLNLRPSDLNLTQETFPYPVLALVMEEGLSRGAFTLTSVADGTTSLYLSSGGGILGGGEHERVRKAATALLRGAQHYYNRATSVRDFPLPQPNQVVFYFVTFNGVRAYVAPKADICERKDPFSKLFYAAHRLISELKKIDEGSSSQEHHAASKGANSQGQMVPQSKQTFQGQAAHTQATSKQTATQVRPSAQRKTPRRTPSLMSIITIDWWAFLCALMPVVVWGLCLALSIASALGFSFVSRSGTELNADAIPICVAIASVVTLLCIPLEIWRVRSFQTLFSTGERISGQVTEIWFVKDRGRIEYTYVHRGKRYTSGAAIHKTKRSKAFCRGQSVDLLVSSSNPKRAIIGALYS
ncbi:MAG: hypothetical protein ACFB4J_07675 [Elainellaceae cyanobacterium]